MFVTALLVYAALFITSAAITLAAMFILEDKAKK